MGIELDPWAYELIDYKRLIKDFGIELFDPEKVKDPNILMRRKIIFGHRDFDKIADAIMKNDKYAVVSGMMPSGKMHIGHKVVVDQLVWYQAHDAEIYIPIADLEAYSTRDVDLDDAAELALNEYVANYAALGLQPERCHIYFQSRNETVKTLAHVLSHKVNWSEMKAIYGFKGETNIGHIYVPLIQAADILHPQLPEFDGAKPTVVPVGADQDPHIRLVRDLAGRFAKEYGFVLPSATFHRLIRGLTGEKMSSTRPKTAIFLSDSLETARKKIMEAKTGGQQTLEEHRVKGGVPEECMIHELFLYHFMDDDDELVELTNKCRAGEIYCGECKERAVEMVEQFLPKLKKQREKARNKLDQYLGG